MLPPLALKPKAPDPLAPLQTLVLDDTTSPTVKRAVSKKRRPLNSRYLRL